MKPFPIPVTAFGAGTQPAEDLELEFLEMPKAEPLRTPIPPEDAAAEELAAAADVVEQLVVGDETRGRTVEAVVGAPKDGTWRI